jgi:hypothetical protein
MFTLPTLLTGVALLSAVSAHGFVKTIVSGGRSYTGWDPGFRYQNPAPSIPAWRADNPDIGFVAPAAYGTQDIICHKSATPGALYVDVQAGSTITLEWFTWPDSHKGPIIDYLAECPGNSCTNVDKAQLQWVKIQQRGWISGLNWVTDELIRNGFKYQLKIPTNIKPGRYVLR